VRYTEKYSGDDLYTSLFVAALWEIDEITQGDEKPLEWLAQAHPTQYEAMVQDIPKRIEEAIGVMALPTFASFLGTWVADYRHIYTFWREAKKQAKMPPFSGRVQ